MDRNCHFEKFQGTFNVLYKFKQDLYKDGNVLWLATNIFYCNTERLSNYFGSLNGLFERFMNYIKYQL